MIEFMTAYDVMEKFVKMVEKERIRKEVMSQTCKHAIIYP